jgi:hypothetical protein
VVKSRAHQTDEEPCSLPGARTRFAAEAAASRGRIRRRLGRPLLHSSVRRVASIHIHALSRKALRVVVHRPALARPVMACRIRFGRSGARVVSEYQRPQPSTLAAGTGADRAAPADKAGRAVRNPMGSYSHCGAYCARSDGANRAVARRELSPERSRWLGSRFLRQFLPICATKYSK